MISPANASAWTGGQYSVFRFLLGAYLFVHFTHLLPWSAEVFSSAGMITDSGDSPLLTLFPNILALADGPVFVGGLILSAAIASILLMLGHRDRMAALWIWFVLACLFGRNPLIANPSLPYVGWMLLAHLFVPPAPYGSLAARGKPPGTHDWVMPRWVFLSAWIVLATSYSYSGYTKLLSPSWFDGETIGYVLQNPLARDNFIRDFMLWLPPVFIKLLTWTVLYVELLFLPLALIPRLRVYLWSAMLVIQFGFAFLLNFLDLTFGMLLFHLLTFDPAWIRARRPWRSFTLFYDGQCALCHGVVRFILAEDTRARISFSPLQNGGTEGLAVVAEKSGGRDTIILVDEDGDIRVRSDAVVMILRQLGGVWWIAGWMLWVVPAPLRNLGYDAVGSVRRRIFGEADSLCPVVPAEIRSRFL